MNTFEAWNKFTIEFSCWCKLEDTNWNDEATDFMDGLLQNFLHKRQNS